MSSSGPVIANGESSAKRGANPLLKLSFVMNDERRPISNVSALIWFFSLQSTSLQPAPEALLQRANILQNSNGRLSVFFPQDMITRRLYNSANAYLHKPISARYIAFSTRHSPPGDPFPPPSSLLPTPQGPEAKHPSMQQRFTMVPFLLVHLFLAALQYDDSPFQYAVLVMRELMLWALPSTAIAILDREIDGAHEDLIEAAEAGRLGRDISRVLWDMFYG
ncbi:uncharacterized protein ARMOST_14220 [Armillaria ostoyae]|uniref:Uncharacterized protein n=1 Tax=Armillaria ostoyae TaxID=47428 RepID=A0A284RPX2_ARMOS|nr:uncharacterized protein ARMOST_14220 [Armillaria ostoyae]